MLKKYDHVQIIYVRSEYLICTASKNSSKTATQKYEYLLSMNAIPNLK